MSNEQDDPVMARIGEAVELGHAGDADGARRRFAEIWETVGRGGDPMHRCALAHYAADVQEDPVEELRWDRLAWPPPTSWARTVRRSTWPVSTRRCT